MDAELSPLSVELAVMADAACGQLAIQGSEENGC
jgi:hypothetical protein